MHNMKLRARNVNDYRPYHVKQRFSKKKPDREKTRKNYLKNKFIYTLNDDCWIHIFKFLPIADRVRIERVCKRWQTLSQESWRTMTRMDNSYLTWGIPVFKINTVILRKVLLKCGRFLKELHLSSSFTNSRLKLSNINNRFDVKIFNIIPRYCPNLINVDISALTISTKNLQLLNEKCTKITKLTLGKSEKDLDNEQNFFQTYSELSYLEVWHNHSAIGKCLSYLPAQTMRTLIINHCIIHDVEFSKGLAMLKYLERFEIYASPFGEKTMEVISNHCKNLKELQIHGFYPRENTNMLQFSKLVNLQVLKVTYFPLSDEHFINISMNCLQITSLDISGRTRVSDNVVRAVATLPKLEYLYINYFSAITDYGLENIRNLKVLECRGCTLITDNGIHKVLALSPQLQFLDLTCCHGITNSTYEFANIICNSRPNKVVLEMRIYGTQIVLTDEHTISPFLRFT